MKRLDLRPDIIKRFSLQFGAFILAIIAVVSFSQYLLSRNHSVTQASQHAASSLRQLSYSAQFMADSAHNILSQLYLDPEINALINATKVDPQQIPQSLNRLNSFTNTLDFIQSIYVYNSQAGQIFSTITGENATCETARFFDTDFVNLLQNPERIPLYTALMREFRLPYVPSDKQISIRVFSFFFVERNWQGQVETALVVNVSAHWFQAVIQNIRPDSAGLVLIIDKQGTLMGSDPELSTTAATDLAPTIRQVLAIPFGSTTLSTTVQNRPSLVCLTSLDKLGWKFVRTIPDSLVYQDAFWLMIETLILSILILIVGGGFFLLIAGRIFRPIRSLMENLERQLSRNTNARAAFRNAFLRNLITGNLAASDSELADQWQAWEISIPLDSPLTLILIRLDGFARFCDRHSLQQRGAQRQSLLSLASGILRDFGPVETIDLDDDCLVLLLGLSPTGVVAVNLSEVLARLQDQAARTSQLSLTVTISAELGFDDRLACGFRAALESSETRFHHGPGRIISTELSKRFPTVDLGFPQDKADRLADRLNQKKFIEALALFGEILDSTRNQTALTVRSVLHRAQIQLVSVLEIAGRKWGLDLAPDLAAYMARLLHCETATECLAELQQLFGSIEEKLDEKHLNRHVELVAEVERYLSQEYPNPGLCIESIAGKFNLSADYLARLFRQHAITSVATRINDIRLEHACRLLTETDQNIQQIAEAVGFANTKYFFTLFKKYHGQTPQEFRRSQADRGYT